MSLHTLIFVGLVWSIASVQSASVFRIAGGQSANIESYPYQVSLRVYGTHFCGGSIISERHILTAAHCTTKYLAHPPYDSVTIHTGTDSSKGSGHVHRVADVTVHPRYIGGTVVVNDIAVITLADSIVFDSTQRKISLPSSPVHDGQSAVITGWGDTVEGGETPTRLQKSRMNILTSSKCDRLSGFDINPTQICASLSVGVGVCSGDSGGPLASNGVVVGVASFIEDSCGQGKPDVYTDVYSFKSFIQSAMSKSSGKPFPETGFPPHSNTELPPDFFDPSAPETGFPPHSNTELPPDFFDPSAPETDFFPGLNPDLTPDFDFDANAPDSDYLPYYTTPKLLPGFDFESSASESDFPSHWNPDSSVEFDFDPNTLLFK